MNKISRITWDPAYSVHVDILDAQHKKLFDIANNLIDLFESGSGDCLPTINELVHYLSLHFQEEHVVMMKANYPGFLSHSREHQKFTDKVEEFLKEYQEGNEDLGLNMITFMKDWLRNHTTKMDMLYAAHLLKSAEKSKN